ncbi:Uncharacterised protein [Shigella sonnei]|nr:Uncharacterised protein [Shigella sonnei]
MTCKGSIATGSAAPSSRTPIIGIRLFNWLASSAPSAAPRIAPIIPALAPCTIKTIMICRGVKPCVCRIATSPCFSITISPSEVIMLNAATATIRLSSKPIIFFSMRTAWNSSPLRSRQSCHLLPSGSFC